MLNTKKIKARMVELGLNQKDAANALHLAVSTISQKISGVRPLYLDEAQALAELLEIADGEFGSYFFCARNCETQSKNERR